MPHNRTTIYLGIFNKYINILFRLNIVTAESAVVTSKNVNKPRKNMFFFLAI